MQIAYLVNRYPAVSHSFIRREIHALEAQGHVVHRFSIRTPADDLPDPADQAERKLTTIVLDGQAGAVLLAGVKWLVRNPRRSLRAAKAAARMGYVGGAFLRHAAYFFEAAWVAEQLKTHCIHHLHAHFGTNPAAVARLVHAFCGVPYSFTVHGPEEFDRPTGLDLSGKITDAAFVVAISNFGRSQLMRWSRVSEWPKLAVVRCGVDEQFLNAVLTEPPSSPRLCCVARLSAQKGLPVLIQACALLKQQQRFELLLIGDGELRRELEDQVRELDLQTEVQFLGARDAAAVRSYIEECRALILPSFAEGLPVVLMEALAMGRPVVATRVAGISELVDERCGWLVPAGSAPALAAAMSEVLLAQPQQLTALGSTGRARVASFHNAGVNASELTKLIQGVGRSS